MGLAVGGALTKYRTLSTSICNTRENVATFDLFISFAHAFHVASKEDVKLHQKLTQAESSLVSELFFQMGHCKKKKFWLHVVGCKVFEFTSFTAAECCPMFYASLL